MRQGDAAGGLGGLGSEFVFSHFVFSRWGIEGEGGRWKRVEGGSTKLLVDRKCESNKKRKKNIISSLYIARIASHIF